MLIAVVFAVLALALWFPETRIGGALRRLLVDEPARRLGKLKRGHVLLLLLVFAGLYVAYLIGRQDGVIVAGQVAADGMGVAMAIDLATWLDITFIALAIAATVRFREAIGLAATHARQWARRCAGLLRAVLTSLARGRARRSRPASRPGRGEDPDGPAPGLAWA
jgi:hypothetical protein